MTKFLTFTILYRNKWYQKSPKCKNASNFYNLYRHFHTKLKSLISLSDAELAWIKLSCSREPPETGKWVKVSRKFINQQFDQTELLTLLPFFCAVGLCFQDIQFNRGLNSCWLISLLSVVGSYNWSKRESSGGFCFFTVGGKRRLTTKLIFSFLQHLIFWFYK